MSSDNGIYILITTDKMKKDGENSWTNMWDDGIITYRVAHCQGIDNLSWYEENQLHNLGYCMDGLFGKCEPIYNREEAWKIARKLHDEYEYTEYGVCEIDYRKYVFPGS